MNDVRSIYRSHKAAFVSAAFPTGKVAQALHAIGTPAYEAWLQAKRESKAQYWGYAPQAEPSFD